MGSHRVRHDWRELAAAAGGSIVKKPPAKVGAAGDEGLIPGSGRSPGEGNGNPLQYLAWEIPWTEESGGLQSVDSQKGQIQLSTTTTTTLHFQFLSSAPLSQGKTQFYRSWGTCPNSQSWRSLVWAGTQIRLMLLSPSTVLVEWETNMSIKFSLTSVASLQLGASHQPEPLFPSNPRIPSGDKTFTLPTSQGCWRY